MNGEGAFLYDAVRTPRALTASRRAGALASVKPIDLLATLYQALETRLGLDTRTVDDVVLGCSTQTGEQGANLAKISSLYAGWSHEISGVTLNRFCASGLDAVAYAAMKVATGSEALVVAGGVESLSRVPMLADNGAWFADPDVAKATAFVHMGVSADLVATLGGFSREACDAYALASHQRAHAARDAGHFVRSVVPVTRDGVTLFDHDDAFRSDASLASLAALPAAFAEIGAAGADALARTRYPQISVVNHVHTAGSSPARVDGASLVVVGSRAAGERLGVQPRARIVASANASVEPVVMLTAGVKATAKALTQAKLTTRDVALFECNESFSATVLDFIARLEIDAAKVNVNGGAIALGHPLGASGGILIGTLLDELERRSERFGVVAMCAGAGIGAAMVIERL